MSARHRMRRTVGRGRFRVPLTLLVAAGLVAVTAVTVRIVSADASGCTGTVALRVAAAPEITPALSRIGAGWMATRPQVDGRCVELTVSAVPAAVMASRLTVMAGHAIDVAAAPEPTPAPGSLAEVWVPDSTAWLGRVNAVDRSAFAPEARSVATSPVVLAMPEAAARRVGWPGSPAPLTVLLPQLLSGGPLTFAIADPRRETASLVATMLLSDSVATTDDELPGLVRTFRSLVKTTDTAQLLGRLGTAASAGPASEQAVIAYDATHPRLSIAAVQLEPAPPNLDYPYAIRSGVSQDAGQAAELFRAAIATPSARAILAKDAFRDPDGKAGPGFPTSGATTTAPFEGFAVDDPPRVARALGLWSAANSPSRTLALFDLTASMATPAGGGLSRAGVMVAAAEQGLDLFASDSEVGMWAFNTGHQQVLSIGTLTPARRSQFNQRMGGAALSPTDRSELYATLLDAYRTMLDGYDASRPNILIVLTDGGDSQPSAARREAFARHLQELADPTRPVRIVLIGINTTGAAAADLQAIAGIVGGGYFPLAKPAQIQTIFLKALLQVGAAG